MISDRTDMQKGGASKLLILVVNTPKDLKKKKNYPKKYV